MSLFKKSTTIEGVNVIWIDNFGFIRIRKAAITEKTKEAISIKMLDNNKNYTFSTSKIRKGVVTILENSEGAIKVVNPEDLRKIDLKSKNISEYRFNLQNLRIQESKSAMNRWVVPKSDMEKLLPLFKILFIGIAVGIIGWAVFKYGSVMFNQIISTTYTQCNTLLPKALQTIQLANSTYLVP
jgi:hypothetical protein